MSRAIQTIASAAGAAGGTPINISLAGLQTDIAGRPANLVALSIRLVKSGAGTVRAQTGTIVIRDASEPLFDAPISELLGQQRERGEAVFCTLGSGSVADVLVATWRPGYGEFTEDAGHAAGLFQGGGSIVLTPPTDGALTWTYEVIAYLDTSGGLRIAPRAITRVLSATTRDIQGDFLLARLRDQTHTDGNSYSVRTSERELLTGVSGQILRQQYENSIGPAGDPVTLTATVQSTITTPNLIRSMLFDYSYGSGGKYPPISKLPRSAGSVTLTAGFAGAPLVTYLYPRSRAEAEALARQACQRHGIAYAAPLPPGNRPEYYPFLPYRLVS